MNIFDQYLDKIKKIILDLSKKGKIILPDNLDGINTEIPPEKFNCDISTNVAMVLSKINKKPSLELAEILAKSLENDDKSIKEVSIVKPGFINIKLQPEFWTNFSKEIIKKGFCVKSQDILINYLIEMNEPISLFFDNVIVNHNNYNIRVNRLNLLKNLHNSISKFSIFELIED